MFTDTEIKFIRLGKASLVDTFYYFANDELRAENMHIIEYFYSSYNNHNACGGRKFLLIKKEPDKLQCDLRDPGSTIIPVCLFTNEKGLAEAVVVLAKGEKQYDKHEAPKEEDDKRNMMCMFKR